MPRRRWLYPADGSPPFEIGADYAPEARLQIIGDEHHAGTVSPDGVDLSSKSKRRDYLRATGLADASDFSPEWRAKNRAAQEREAHQARKSAIVESFKKLSRR